MPPEVNAELIKACQKEIETKCDFFLTMVFQDPGEMQKMMDHALNSKPDRATSNLMYYIHFNPEKLQHLEGSLMERALFTGVRIPDEGILLPAMAEAMNNILKTRLFGFYKTAVEEKRNLMRSEVAQSLNMKVDPSLVEPKKMDIIILPRNEEAESYRQQLIASARQWQVSNVTAS